MSKPARPACAPAGRAAAGRRAKARAATARRTRGATTSAVRAFLKGYPEIRSVDVLCADLWGILRGKRLPVGELEALFSEGMRLPGAACALGVTAEIGEPTGTGLSGGPDHLCFPVPGTLAPVPWSPQPVGQVLASLVQDNGKPYALDPRNILADVAQRFAALELRPMIALELEFYLLDRESAPNGGPRPPILLGKRAGAGPIYGVRDLAQAGAFLESLYRACNAQGIPARAAIGEWGPGQLELALAHQDDVLRACDHAILLKRAVKGVAQQHDMHATFMAKPYRDYPGSGLHVHLSLLGRGGRNVFAEGGLESNGDLGAAIGGLLATLAECMAIFAPNENSFRRVRAGGQAPTVANWGDNDRTAAIRVPTSKAQDRRIEHRVAGADANVYLATAAVLMGVCVGLENRMAAPGHSNSAAARAAERLPVYWSDALRLFDQSKRIKTYLGTGPARIYSSTKWRELREFATYITPCEYAWYLDLD